MGDYFRQFIEARGMLRTQESSSSAMKRSPTLMVQMLKETGRDENVSWLGRWENVGWAIRIGRKLTDGEWRVFGQHAEETWDEEQRRYDPAKSLALLQRLFPDEELTLVYPRCNKRIKTDGKTSGGIPVHMLCDTYGTNAVQVYAASGDRICVARCDDHAGQL